jgi:hypothetical protein
MFVYKYVYCSMQYNNELYKLLYSIIHYSILVNVIASAWTPDR